MPRQPSPAAQQILDADPAATYVPVNELPAIVRPVDRDQMVYVQSVRFDPAAYDYRQLTGHGWGLDDQLFRVMQDGDDSPIMITFDQDAALARMHSAAYSVGMAAVAKAEADTDTPGQPVSVSTTLELPVAGRMVTTRGAYRILAVWVRFSQGDTSSASIGHVVVHADDPGKVLQVTSWLSDAIDFAEFHATRDGFYTPAEEDQLVDSTTSAVS